MEGQQFSDPSVRTELNIPTQEISGAVSFCIKNRHMLIPYKGYGPSCFDITCSGQDPLDVGILISVYLAN